MRAEPALVVLPGTAAPPVAPSDGAAPTAPLHGGRQDGAFVRPGPRDSGAGWLALRARPVLLAVWCGLVASGVGFLLPTKPKDAVALLAGAAVVVAVMLRPLFGAVLLVALVPATSGLAPGFPVSHVRLSEAVIGVVGVTLIASVRRSETVPWGTLDWVLLGYGLAWAILAVLAQRQLHQHLTLSEWGTALGQLQFFLVYRGVRVAVRSERERRLALLALLVASLPVAFLAVLQEMHLHVVQSFINTLTGGLTMGIAPSGAGSATRVTGPFSNWAALAGYMLPIVLVVVAIALSKVQVHPKRWIAVVGVAAGLAMVLTLEQSAIVCALAGMFFLLRRYDRDGRTTRFFVVGVVVLGVVASPVLVNRLIHELAPSPGTGRTPFVPETLSFRWGVWTRQYLPAIEARPLIGYGMVYPASISWIYPESQYISFLMEGGLVMVAAFAALAWAMFRRAGAAVQAKNPLDQALGMALVIAVASMLVMNVTWPFLSNGGMPQVLWALMALLLPARRPEGVGAGALWHRRDATGPGLATAGNDLAEVGP